MTRSTTTLAGLAAIAVTGAVLSLAAQTPQTTPTRKPSDSVL